MAFLRHHRAIINVLQRPVTEGQFSRCAACGRSGHKLNTNDMIRPLRPYVTHQRYGLYGSESLRWGLGHFHFTQYSTDASKKPRTQNPEFEILDKKDSGQSEGGKELPPEPPVTPFKKRALIVAFLLATWGGVYLAAQYTKKKDKVEEREHQVSQVDIGARDYELIDHTGKTRTKSDFSGKWLLLYFGFTHCPDICPEELEKMAEIIDIIDGDKSVPDLQPIFISVDPERDTPEVIANYIAEFHKKFIGLTGTKEQVKEAAKTFRVYFSAGPRDEDNDYVVDHTIVMYLMNPKGMFVDYYGSRGTPNEVIASGIKTNMKNYSRLHGS